MNNTESTEIKNIHSCKPSCEYYTRGKCVNGLIVWGGSEYQCNKPNTADECPLTWEYEKNITKG